MFCPRCGREAVAGAVYCPHCGVRLPAAEEAGAVGEPPAEGYSTRAESPAGAARQAGGPARDPATGGSPGAPAASPWLAPPGIPGAPASPAAAPGASAAAGPAAVAAAAVRYGGFWRRGFAFLLDAGILWVASSLIQVGMRVDLLAPDLASPRTLAANLAAIVVGWLYCALLESSARQATLGQQILDIKVTDLQQRRVSFARATGRHFAQILSVFLLFAGYLMIAFTARKQALHDMVAGCLVVRAT